MVFQRSDYFREVKPVFFKLHFTETDPHLCFLSRFNFFRFIDVTVSTSAQTNHLPLGIILASSNWIDGPDFAFPLTLHVCRVDLIRGLAVPQGVQRLLRERDDASGGGGDAAQRPSEGLCGQVQVLTPVTPSSSSTTGEELWINCFFCLFVVFFNLQIN